MSRTVPSGDDSSSDGNSAVYELANANITQCSHRLPPLLGDCPADTFIAQPLPPSTLPNLVFSFRHHPSLSTGDTLRTQVLTFLTQLLSVRTKRHQPLLHGQLVHFEGDTTIGAEINRGVLCVSLPPPTLQAFLSSLPPDVLSSLQPSASDIVCLLVSAGEMQMAEKGGVTRLLALKAWKEAEYEREQRQSDHIHFYPFPLCSDLSRNLSLVPLPTATTEAAADKKPVEHNELSKREQLQLKLKAKREQQQQQQQQQQPQQQSGELKWQSSLLDRMRCYSVYGSSVCRDGRTVRLEVGDEAEMRAVMRQAITDGERDKRPIALLLGLPNAEQPLKVWSAYHTTPPASSASGCTLLTPSIVPSDTASDACVVYGSFLCLLPSAASTTDEGREVEDGFGLFLTVDSARAITRYLGAGKRLAMQADSATGLHFDICWQQQQQQSRQADAASKAVTQPAAEQSGAAPV